MLKPMPYVEIASFLQGLEERYPVAEWRIAGIHIWPLLRIEIAVNLRRLNYIGSFAPTRKATFKAGSLIHSIWRDREHEACISRRVDIALFGISSGKTRITGQYYNQYIDPLRLFLEDNHISSIHVERDKSGDPGLPRFASSVILSYPLMRPVFWLIKRSIRMHGVNAQLVGLDRLRAELSAYLDKDDFLLPASQIWKFEKLVAYKIFYTMFLRLIRPRIVILQCFYSSDSMAISWACRSLSIPCFDYQHGVQGASHYAYSAWCNIPFDGYELFPTGFLTWDEGSTLQLKQWVGRNVSVYTIGNLWHEAFDNFRQDFAESLNELGKQAMGRIIVLYTMQDFLPPSWIVATIRNTPSVFWCIRMHPQYKTVKEPFVEAIGAAKNFEIDVSTILPLPSLLRMADIHVTGSSSVVREAEIYGVHSIVTDQIGITYYSDSIRGGLASFALDESELRRIILERGGKDQHGMNPQEYPDRSRFVAEAKAAIRT